MNLKIFFNRVKIPNLRVILFLCLVFLGGMAWVPSAWADLRESHDKGNNLRGSWEIATTKEKKVIRHGPFRRFHPNGKLALYGRYRNNIPTGVWRWWASDGRLIRSVRRFLDYDELLYGKDLEKDISIFKDIRGIKIAEGLLKRDMGHGLWKYWHQDGAPKAQGRFLNGIPHNRWTQYFPNGQVEFIVEYEMGIRHGLFLSAFVSGQEAEKGAYDQGVQVGVWRTWHKNGQLKTKGIYVEDLKEGPWKTWEKDGWLKVHNIFKEGKMVGEEPVKERKIPVFTTEAGVKVAPNLVDENGNPIKPIEEGKASGGSR